MDRVALEAQSTIRALAYPPHVTLVIGHRPVNLGYRVTLELITEVRLPHRCPCP